MLVISRVISLAVSPVWEKKKLAASLALDKTVKLWNMEEYSLQLSHRAHTVSTYKSVDSHNEEFMKIFLCNYYFI